MKPKTKVKVKPKVRVNPWLVHLSKVRSQNKGKSFKELATLAKKSYKK